MRILTSLLAMGWLGAGVQAQTPPSALKPMPTTTSLDTAPKAGARTLYFQKDSYPTPMVPTGTATVPTAPAKSAILPARYQVPPDDTSDSQFKLPPGVERAIDRASKPGEKGLPSSAELFTLKSEVQVLQSTLDDSIGLSSAYSFVPAMLTKNPDPNKDNGEYRALSTSPFPGRFFEPHVLRVEPNFTCYHRLYFEELNSERYGWDLGPIQPVVSTGYFIKDLLLLPYHYGTRPFQRYDCGAGHCLPGDPVPYLLYPAEISLTGGLLEAGIVVGGFAVLP
ncbi:MAG: hypothetical protein U0746_13355 [Gemmataceae bacterium]